MDIFTAIDKAAASTTNVAHGVKPEQLSQPTSCPEWNVQGLMTHMVGGYHYFGAVAAGENPARGGGEGQAPPPSDAASLEAAVKKAAQNWRRPGALDGTWNSPFGEVPRAVAATINAIEIYIHGWDLAQATGQKVDADPELVALMGDSARQIMQPASRESGAFGAEVATGPDASDLDKLVAYLGRQP
jgi:uncharacterized protein (TIGR03086 family)